jgi:hypothetical protein
LKPINISVAFVLLLALAGTLIVAQADPTPPPKTVTIAGAFSFPQRNAAMLVVLGRAPAATATTVSPIFALAQAAQTAAPTLPDTLSATPTIAAGETATNAPLAAALIWVVIIIVVAVTVFLVWRTRPKRG